MLKQLSCHETANIIGWLSVVLGALSQLVLAPVIISYIGLAGLGTWHLLFQTFNYLQLVDIGLSNGIVRQIAAAKKKPQELADVTATAKTGLTIVGFLFSVIGMSACFIVPYFVKIPAPLRMDFVVALALLAAWGIFRYHYVLPLLSLRGNNRIVEFNALNLIQGPGRPILGAIFLAFKLKLIGIASGYMLVEALIRVMASRMQTTPRKIGRYCHKYLIKMLTFGGATAVISISTLVIFYSSSFIVGWRMDITSIAIFQSTIALPFFVARLAIIPFTNFLPGFISYYEGANSRRLRIWGQNAHYIVIVATLVILVFTCIINKQFITFWVGESLFAGHHFTICYGIFIFMYIASYNGYLMYQAIDRLKPILICHLIELPVNIGLSIILIEKWGLVGIPYAFMLAHLPVTIVSQFPFFCSMRQLDNVVDISHSV